MEQYNYDLDKYIMFLDTASKRLASMGEPMKENELIAVLLRGLPSPFTPIKLTCKLPNAPDKFPQVVQLLRDWAGQEEVKTAVNALQNPTQEEAFTATTERSNRQQVFSTTAREACRNYIAGRCRNGVQCRFSHGPLPQPERKETRTCHNCGLVGHLMRNCRKKRQEIANQVCVSQAVQQSSPEELIFVVDLHALSTSTKGRVDLGWRCYRECH